MVAVRSGISLVEVLVACGCIALLLGIALPSIALVRESSRRTICSSRLRQIGIASLQFEAMQGHLPTSKWQDELLVNLEVVPPGVELPAAIGEAAFSVFVCPSESNTPTHTDRDWYGNYLFCFGSWLDDTGKPTGIIENYNDDSAHPIRLADVIDGTTHTAMVSEALHGKTSLSASDARQRILWMTSGQMYSLAEKEALAEACLSIPSSPASAGWMGSFAKGNLFTVIGERSVSMTGVGGNLYNHVLPPQSPSCTNAGDFFSGISTATSGHPGIVVVCYCDGHIDSVASSIDRKVWQDLGTRE